MNKQELIDYYNVLKESKSRFINCIDVDRIIDKIKQLDEPRKVKAKQFVADFIAEQKKLGHTLSYSIDASMSDRVAEWYWDNSELFALAWIFGYEVEEEKRYRVRLKGLKKGCNCLNHDTKKDEWNFMSKYEIGEYRTAHTRKELEEAGFGWVFDCPGIEIDEVEG